VTLHRALAILALAAIVATRLEPALLQLPFVDRSAQAQALAAFPDRRWPQYPGFLAGVRARTAPGDTVAILVPASKWDGGYDYAYYRASYFLTGREVLPLVDQQSRELPDNLRAARYIAAFGVTLPAAAEVVWHGEGGTLYRR
jgi:hypothetical protein